MTEDDGKLNKRNSTAKGSSTGSHFSFFKTTKTTENLTKNGEKKYPQTFSQIFWIKMKKKKKQRLEIIVDRKKSRVGERKKRWRRHSFRCRHCCRRKFYCFSRRQNEQQHFTWISCKIFSGLLAFKISIQIFLLIYFFLLKSRNTHGSL